MWHALFPDVSAAAALNLVVLAVIAVPFVVGILAGPGAPPPSELSCLPWQEFDLQQSVLWCSASG
jgi:hypothetical protein